MKITAVEIHNFKRIKDIRIAPDADRALILIGGKNAQGKSSLLDALTAALGGAKALPSDAVRHGAEGAQVIVELDDGMVVTRRITPTGESTLEVRDKLGSVKAPQAALDKLIAGRFLDPLAFLALPAKQQRAALMAVIPDAKRIEELDTKRARAFDRRTEVGRDLTKAEGELARLPVADVGTFFDVAALTAEMRIMQEVQREGDKIAMAQQERASRVAREFTARNAITDKIEELKKETLRLEVELDAANESLDVARDNAKAVEDQLAAAAAKWQAMAPRRIELEAAINASEKTNREYYAAKATADRRVETEATVQKLQSERTDLTKVLGVIDERKASILAAAALPVPGLSVTDDGVTLSDVPLAQASGAERLRVALALAIAAAPALDDIWVRDAALLDDDSVQLVAEHAAAAGKRVWLERVGTADPGVIVISDGKVLEGAR